MQTDIVVYIDSREQREAIFARLRERGYEVRSDGRVLACQDLVMRASPDLKARGLTPPKKGLVGFVGDSSAVLSNSHLPFYKGVHEHLVRLYRGY